VNAPENPWIEWSGGECPVDRNELVEVKYRDGEIETIVARNAIFKFCGDWWLHTGEEEYDPSAEQYLVDHGCDIIAYRKVQS
jgi:hypothetical protein